jgi:hypothetical protein
MCRFLAILLVAISLGCAKEPAAKPLPDEPPRLALGPPAKDEIRIALSKAGSLTETGNEFGESANGMVYATSLKGKEAENMWTQLTKTMPKIGYWPVAIGGADTAAKVRDKLKVVPVKREKVPVLGVQEWFAQRAKSDPERFKAPAGEWNDTAPTREVYEALTLKGYPGPRPWCYFLFVPVKNQFETLEVLNFGGFGECPTAEQHAVILSYWNKKYDARLFTVTPNMIEMDVMKPPQNQEEAMKLAKEQFLYAPDTVHKGAGSVEALASGLIDGNRWTFTWPEG